jgi:hypothetical protein
MADIGPRSPNDPDTNPSLKVTDEDRVKFHMAEFQAAKSEISELLRQTSTTLTFAISMTGGITAWLVAHDMPPVTLNWARWVPLGITVLMGLLALSYLIRTLDKGDYLRKLERRLAAQGLGWERETRRRPWVIVATHLILWGALNLLALTVAKHL